MLMLVAGLIPSLGIYSLSIANEPLRNRLAARLGVTGWKAAYAAIAVICFVLIIQGCGPSLKLRQRPVR